MGIHTSHLGLHRVGRGAEEVFDAQVLFDPAAEPSKARQTAVGSPEGGAQRHQQFDLPAVLLKRGDRLRLGPRDGW